MSRILSIIILSFISVFATAQDSQSDSVQWVLPATIHENGLKDGQYLVIELPSEYKDSGFIEISTGKSFAVGNNGYLPLADVDTIYSHFDPNFKANVIDIRFGKLGAERLLKYTMRWKGYRVGFVLNNKLVYTAQLDWVPISGGNMILIGPRNKEDLLKLVSALRRVASH